MMNRPFERINGATNKVIIISEKQKGELAMGEKE